MLFAVHFFVCVLAIGHCRVDRKESGRERGKGSGKPGLELGSHKACRSVAHEAVGSDY